MFPLKLSGNICSTLSHEIDSLFLKWYFHPVPNFTLANFLVAHQPVSYFNKKPVFNGRFLDSSDHSVGL